MILTIDVQYVDNTGYCAGVMFDNWKAHTSYETKIITVTPVAEYESGFFYRRELPCILRLLDSISHPLDFIVIDGFVFLDGGHKPGLGKYLYDVLDSKIPVIGVAKSSFCGISPDCAILRADSKKELYVTAIGINLEDAKAKIISMHGKFRMPTLLKQADTLCREAAKNAYAPESIGLGF